MEPHLSLRRLEVFCLVVEERSVTRAAKVLLVAQPAISAQLRALEGWVGARLFERQGNRLVLTEAGERTHRWARSVLASAAEIRREVGDLDTGQRGHVIIWSSLALGTYVVPPIVARLGRERPQAELTVAISAPDDVVHAVESGACDFALLAWDERPLPDGVDSERLAFVPLEVYATEALVAPGSELSVDEAMSLPFVGAPLGVTYQRHVETQLRAADHRAPNVVLRLGHAEALKSAAVTNDWALIAPAYAVKAEVAQGTLHRVDVTSLDLHEEIILIRRHGKLFSPLQQAALDALRSEVPGMIAPKSADLATALPVHQE